jgi:protein-L-isoaspartate(D-aspartate) O-methyltransferase
MAQPANGIQDMTPARERMVEQQLARRGIRDERVLAAMRRVPREAFVAPGMEEFAYEDNPLSIGEGQTISQPYVVALMTEAAEVKPGDRVLDIGTGSGYAAAVLAEIVDAVHTVERHHALAESAKRRLSWLGYRNIAVRHGDGTLGWPEAAPFDAIVVAAGGPDIPLSLRGQLMVGGRLVIPIGHDRETQRLVKLVRTGEDTYREEDLGAVRFVPLVGIHGWSEKGYRTP